MASPHVASSRLVEYLIFVGPEQKDETMAGYCEISEGTVLRQFPMHCHKDCPLSSRVANFCQPQCGFVIDEIHSHIFTMTDTETNQKLYGVCDTFPYEVHGSSSHDPDVVKETVPLSICVLSQQLFFNFFQNCLKALTNMVDSCFETVSWIDLFYQSNSNSVTATLVNDIEKWIEKLLNISTPDNPSMLLEVTLDINSPIRLCYPPSHELPLCELPVRQLFQHLRPHTVNEIIRLILTEQKVTKLYTVCTLLNYTLCTPLTGIDICQEVFCG